MEGQRQREVLLGCSGVDSIDFIIIKIFDSPEGFDKKTPMANSGSMRPPPRFGLEALMWSCLKDLRPVCDGEVKES